MKYLRVAKMIKEINLVRSGTSQKQRHVSRHKIFGTDSDFHVK